jgi:TPR repeat protein
MSATSRCHGTASNRLVLPRAWAACAVLTLTSGGICDCDAGSSHPCNRSLDLCHSACHQGEARSCTALGEAYYRGLGVKQSFALAAYYYEEACALGCSDACFRLGQMYETGQGICQDAVAAVERYGMACVFSDDRGCYETGRVFGRCRGTPKAAELARLFYRIACARHDPRGCDALKQPFGNLHHRHPRRRFSRQRQRQRPDPVRPGPLD